jgi:Rps23 Pro-64 3,4-dihydroxylase Tpa1-like proline 4-hydroxylase
MVSVILFYFYFYFWHSYHNLKLIESRFTERRKEQIAKRKEEEEKYREEQNLRKLQETEEKLDSTNVNELASVDQLVMYLKRFQDEEKKEEEKVDVQIKEPEGVVRIGKSARGFDDDIFGTKVNKSKKEKAPKKATNKKV